MDKEDEVLNIDLENTGQVDTISLALAVRRAKEKGWLTAPQVDDIIADANRFRSRLTQGEIITTGDLDAPTSTGVN